MQLTQSDGHANAAMWNLVQVTESISGSVVPLAMFHTDIYDRKYLVAKDTGKDGNVVGLIEHILC